MEAKDYAAFGALAISVISLAWQALNAYRTRKRLSVSAGIITSWSPATEDQSRHAEFQVHVTSRSLGGKNGIESYDFEWQPEPQDCGFSSLDVPQPVAGTSEDVLLIADVHKANRVLEEGEVVHKVFRLWAGGSMHDVDRPYILRALVRLSNGKVYRSNDFVLLPKEMAPEQDQPLRQHDGR
jgi:hypothetical protein